MNTRYVFAIVGCLITSTKLDAQVASAIFIPVIRDTVYWMPGAPFRVPLGPPGDLSLSTRGPCRIEKGPAYFGTPYWLIVDPLDPPAGHKYYELKAFTCCVVASKGRKQWEDCRVIQYVQPLLTIAFDAWPALRVLPGRRYNPTTPLRVPVPHDHLETVVMFDGRITFQSPGTEFRLTHGDNLALTIPKSVRMVNTTVFWKPHGTPDPSQWVPLISTDSTVDALIPWGGRSVEILQDNPLRLRSPVTVSIPLTPWRRTVTVGPLEFEYQDGDMAGRARAVDVDCPACDSFGTHIATMDSNGTFSLKIDLPGTSSLSRSTIPQTFYVHVLATSPAGVTKPSTLPVTLVPIPRMEITPDDRSVQMWAEREFGDKAIAFVVLPPYNASMLSYIYRNRDRRIDSLMRLSQYFGSRGGSYAKFIRKITEIGDNCGEVTLEEFVRVHADVFGHEPNIYEEDTAYVAAYVRSISLYFRQHANAVYIVATLPGDRHVSVLGIVGVRYGESPGDPPLVVERLWTPWTEQYEAGDAALDLLEGVSRGGDGLPTVLRCDQ